jgi:hypothetical protein
MVPETNDTVYLSNSGKAIFRAMTSADPDAVWVMQGWIFYFEVSQKNFYDIETSLTDIIHFYVDKGLFKQNMGFLSHDAPNLGAILYLIDVCQIQR